MLKTHGGSLYTDKHTLLKMKNAASEVKNTLDKLTIYQILEGKR